MVGDLDFEMEREGVTESEILEVILFVLVTVKVAVIVGVRQGDVKQPQNFGPGSHCPLAPQMILLRFTGTGGKSPSAALNCGVARLGAQ